MVLLTLGDDCESSLFRLRYVFGCGLEDEEISGFLAFLALLSHWSMVCVRGWIVFLLTIGICGSCVSLGLVAFGQHGCGGGEH